MKKAFSLIELMLVVAISAAISAIAIPNYKDYVNKAKVAEMISTIDPCQTQVYQSYLKDGTFPDSDKVTCPVKGKISAYYSTTAAYSQFIVTNADLYRAGNKDNPYKLYIRLTINEDTGDISFSCGWPATGESNGVPKDLMPSSCTDKMT